ncbi:unnamed protein product, partial [Amoebophrya sp. A120]|eukprot:GSA120T00004691001.1
MTPQLGGVAVKPHQGGGSCSDQTSATGEAGGRTTSKPGSKSRNNKSSLSTGLHDQHLHTKQTDQAGGGGAGGNHKGTTASLSTSQGNASLVL